MCSCATMACMCVANRTEGVDRVGTIPSYAVQDITLCNRANSSILEHQEILSNLTVFLKLNDFLRTLQSHVLYKYKSIFCVLLFVHKYGRHVVLLWSSLR